MRLEIEAFSEDHEIFQRERFAYRRGGLGTRRRKSATRMEDLFAGLGPAGDNHRK